MNGISGYLATKLIFIGGNKITGYFNKYGGLLATLLTE